MASHVTGGSGPSTVAGGSTSKGVSEGKLQGRKVSKEESLLALQKELQKQKLSSFDIQKILSGCKKNWEGFVVVDPARPGRLRQCHGIKGLKIYKDPRTGELIADFGTATLMKGGMKRAKEGFRIKSLTGEIFPIVRYTSLKKISGDRSYDPNFVRDISQEIGTRKKLGKIPHLLGMEEIEYINKFGVLKKRYIAEKCDGALGECMFVEGNIYSQKLPLSEQKPEVVLQSCIDVLTALSAIHKKGFVHFDIKPGNILFLNGRGKLADLGFCAASKSELLTRGTLGFTAPELFKTEKVIADPKMDMFSFGMTLLAFTNPQMMGKLASSQRKLLDGAYTEAQYMKKLQNVRGQLEMGTPMEKLIFRLTDPNPQLRPDAEAARLELQHIKMSASKAAEEPQASPAAAQSEIFFSARSFISAEEKEETEELSEFGSFVIMKREAEPSKSSLVAEPVVELGLSFVAISKKNNDINDDSFEKTPKDSGE